MHRIVVYWFTCVLMSAAAALATTIVLPTDEQLIAKSPLIVEGTVRSTKAVAQGSSIWTETVVSVSRVVKGTAPDTVTVREIGGVIGDRITRIYGAPDFATGEHVLLFLTPTPRGDYQTVDLFIGKFSSERMADGRALWMRDDTAGDVTLLDAQLEPIRARNVQRESTAFAQFVDDRVAGRAGVNAYGVENPILERRAGSTGRFTPAPDFTLLSEGSIYRWFAFESGGRANWYSYGTQPGYSGGGTNEVQTAMAAWNNYSAARISYTYAGSTNTRGGTGAPNGVNEVLFNDPNEEIAGSWNRSTGGVVGLGGYNGVRSGGSWTSPFAADAQHPQRTYQAWNIVEGNLTIQDNVSSTTGISSARLAEIIAHEFGHTLGFGHSSDNTALMFASVTGLGPSLRPDDELAARWLYPNGDNPPPPPPPTPQPPAAPGGLTATVSGTTVTLRWVDNASNETGNAIYVAQGSGSFSHIGDTAADSSGATLNGFASGTTNRIYVEAFNAAGSSAASNTVTVSIDAPLAAGFTITPSSGVARQTTFSFADGSTGSVVSRMWRFGDGATSTALNATHVYDSAGQFTVTLTVNSSSGQSTATHLVTVSAPVPATPPVEADWDSDRGVAAVGQAIAFRDRSTGSPTNWSWWFGDGAVSSQQNPVHAFASAGSYAVILTASNASSSSMKSHQITIAPDIAAFRSLVSVTAQTNGASGSVWRTELSLFNAGNESANIEMTFIPSSGGSVQSRSQFLGPRQSLTYANALPELFGMQTGAGALAIEATSATATPALKISSRTFNSGAAGTYGQAVPDVPTEDLSSTSWLPALASTADFRTNVGLVNRSSNAATVGLTLFDGNGNTIGTANVSLPPNNFQQSGLGSVFPAVASGSWSALSLRATTSVADAVSVYASVVDNRTQDPVYLQGSPGVTGARAVIPAVGRAPGANGTYWRSDVILLNPSAVTTTATLRYLPAGSDNRSAVARSVSLRRGSTTVLSDVLSLFGMTSGTGALEITWSGSVPPVITSRTYTTNATGGTFGQSIDPISSFASDLYVPGLRSDGFYRSNIGFVNGGDTSIDVDATLLSASGNAVGTGRVTLPPRSQGQYALTGIFAGVNVATLGNFTLQAHTATPGALFAYGSIVDNASGDPVFFAGK